jgi:hypothetical protein
MDFEIIPLFFELDAKASPPSIWVSCQCVSHVRKPIKSLAGEIFQFYLNGSNPAIESIPLKEPPAVESHRSRPIVFRRVLTTLEVEALRHTFASDGRFHATLRLRVDGRAGRKDVEFDPRIALSMNGWAIGVAGLRPGAPTV